MPSAHDPKRRNAMSIFKPTFRLFGAVAALSTAIATPGLAQPVIQEPGYCAFFYPNANCQNKGPGNPYTDPNYRRAPVGNEMWSRNETVGIASKRPRTHRSKTSAMRTR